MLVRNSLPDLVVQVLVSQGLECLQTLVGQRWPKPRLGSPRTANQERVHQLCAIGFWVVVHGKVDVEKSDLHHRIWSVARSKVNLVSHTSSG